MGRRFQYCPWRIGLYYGEESRRVIYHCYSFHPPARVKRRFSLDLHLENLVGFLGRKDLKIAGGPMIEAPGVSHCHISPHPAWSKSLQLLVKWSGSTFIIPVASFVSLWTHLSLQISGCGLHWNFISLMNSRKDMDFQLFQHGWEWSLPSSAHVKVETRSLKNKISLFAYQTSKFKKDNIQY